MWKPVKTKVQIYSTEYLKLYTNEQKQNSMNLLCTDNLILKWTHKLDSDYHLSWKTLCTAHTLCWSCPRPLMWSWSPAKCRAQEQTLTHPGNGEWSCVIFFVTGLLFRPRSTFHSLSSSSTPGFSLCSVTSVFESTCCYSLHFALLFAVSSTVCVTLVRCCNYKTHIIDNKCVWSIIFLSERHCATACLQPTVCYAVYC